MVCAYVFVYVLCVLNRDRFPFVRDSIGMDSCPGQRVGLSVFQGFHSAILQANSGWASGGRSSQGGEIVRFDPIVVIFSSLRTGWTTTHWGRPSGGFLYSAGG